VRLDCEGPFGPLKFGPSTATIENNLVPFSMTQRHKSSVSCELGGVSFFQINSATNEQLDTQRCAEIAPHNVIRVEQGFLLHYGKLSTAPVLPWSWQAAAWAVKLTDTANVAAEPLEVDCDSVYCVGREFPVAIEVQ
jgi:hypothetical protein